jgi:hypothetical protein
MRVEIRVRCIRRAFWVFDDGFGCSEKWSKPFVR